jgi:hypothetical protein
MLRYGIGSTRSAEFDRESSIGFGPAARGDEDA